MLTLFARAKVPIVLGVQLEAGEHGYIIVRNRRNQMAVFDHLPAKRKGIYRSHNMMLESDDDFAMVFSIVTHEPVPALDRSAYFVFNRKGSTLTDIISWMSDEGRDDITVVRSTVLAVITGFRPVDQNEIILNYHNKI